MNRIQKAACKVFRIETRAEPIEGTWEERMISGYSDWVTDFFQSRPALMTTDCLDQCSAAMDQAKKMPDNFEAVLQGEIAGDIIIAAYMDMERIKKEENLDPTDEEIAAHPEELKDFLGPDFS